MTDTTEELVRKLGCVLSMYDDGVNYDLAQDDGLVVFDHSDFEAVLRLLSSLKKMEAELKEAGAYTDAHKRLDDLAYERRDAAEARANRMEEALRKISQMDWSHENRSAELGLAETAAIVAKRVALSALQSPSGSEGEEG